MMEQLIMMGNWQDRGMGIGGRRENGRPTKGLNSTRIMVQRTIIMAVRRKSLDKGSGPAAHVEMVRCLGGVEEVNSKAVSEWEAAFRSPFRREVQRRGWQISPGAEKATWSVSSRACK